MPKNKKSKITTETITFFCIFHSVEIEKDYEKLKHPIKTLEKGQIILKEILLSLGIEIPKEVLPVAYLQMYPAEDFINRELYCNLEAYSFLVKEIFDKNRKIMPLFNGMPVHSSGGRFGNEIDPIFKEFNFDESKDTMHVLYFALPVVFIGEEKKVEKVIDKIIDFECDSYEGLENCLKVNFELSGNFMIFPPGVAEFLAEEATGMKDALSNEIKNSKEIKFSTLSEKTRTEL